MTIHNLVPLATLTTHQLVPLATLALNLTLLTLVLYRDHQSRLNRMTAYFLAGVATWNVGVFGLRLSDTAAWALVWERVVFLGLIPLPALYYHFVLLFLDLTHRRRRVLTIAYVLTGVFLLSSFSEQFITGVTGTRWGFVPVGGLAYYAFLVFMNIFMVTGLVQLGLAYARLPSSFRRNRAKLILWGTVISLLGGYVDFVRAIFPGLGRLYPVGIPANAVFALLLGIAVVRYRLVDVGAVAKRVAIYAGLVAGVLPLVIGLVNFLDTRRQGTYAAGVLIAFIVAIILTPLTRWIERQVDRLVFRKRYAFQEILAHLRGRMGSLLDVSRLADTLVQTLVHRIPLTHGVLYLLSRELGEYRVERVVVSSGAIERAWTPLSVGHPLVRWLTEHPRVVVTDEIRLDRDMNEALAGAEAELGELGFALMLPLQTEGELMGILALGEKLSGDVFDAQELQLLEVLAGQATIALQTSRLYEEVKRSNEQLVEVGRQRSRFLAQFSHELRTPLNSIIGFSRILLKDTTLPAEATGDLQAVHSNGVHLLHLINDVLDFAKIESDTVVLKTESIEVEPIVSDCVRSAESLIRGRPILLRQEIEPDLPPVQADPTKFRQVLLNLLSNALKFTAEGEVTVRAATHQEDLLVTVTDTGVGIREEDQPKLFRAFQQLHGGGMHLPLGGTGLGLAISRTFVELHGGKIWMESRPGRGSTFAFTVPLEAVATR
jgi:signal transduction histidine kinase